MELIRESFWRHFQANPRNTPQRCEGSSTSKSGKERVILGSVKFFYRWGSIYFSFLQRFFDFPEFFFFFSGTHLFLISFFIISFKATLFFNFHSISTFYSYFLSHFTLIHTYHNLIIHDLNLTIRYNSGTYRFLL